MSPSTSSGQTFTLTSENVWGLDLSGTMQGVGGVGGLLKEGDLYTTYDANGNIMQKLDSEGETVMSATYDPFGNLIEGALVGGYGFSTKPLIENLNWYYYGYRYYDPVTGRWPNRDPIEEMGGINLYGMAMNNPINSYDLLGLEGIGKYLGWLGKLKKFFDFFFGPDDCRNGAEWEGEVDYNCNLKCKCCIEGKGWQTFTEQKRFTRFQREKCVDKNWTLVSASITDDSNCVCTSGTDCTIESREDEPHKSR